jgi:hypothetical protein
LVVDVLYDTAYNRSSTEEEPEAQVTSDQIGDSEEQVELGHEVAHRRKPSGGAVVAVRVPRDLLERMNAYGKLRGLTVSDVMRQGAERLVSGTVQLHHVSGATVYGPGVVAGSPSQGGTLRSVTTKEWTEHPTSAPRPKAAGKL